MVYPSGLYIMGFLAGHNIGVLMAFVGELIDLLSHLVDY